MQENTSSVFFWSGFLVKKLTRGTRTNPKSIANAPALIGERMLSLQPNALTLSTKDGKSPKLKRIICTTVMPTPEMKLAHTEAFVIFFENRPYIKGAKKAPAKAPQEIDIRVEM